MPEYTNQQVLATPMGYNDAGAHTIGQYLAVLLDVMWESDDAKPFGNSGWKNEVFSALAAAGLINATEDPYGGYTNMDTRAGERLIQDAIRSLGVV